MTTYAAPYFIAHVVALEGGAQWTVPINPETYSITAGRNYDEQSMLGYRDIPMVGYAKLEHLNFTALLPGRKDDSFTNPGNFMLPVPSYSRLHTWATGAGGGKVRPLRVTIPGLWAGTMFLVSANLSTQPAQEFGDCWVELEFVTWIDPSKPPSEGELPPSLPNPYSPIPIPLIIYPPVPVIWPPYLPPDTRPPTEPDPKYQPSVYEVQAGDTLWSIARHVYGEGTGWRRIWATNKPLLSGDPNELTVGEQLTIPRS